MQRFRSCFFHLLLIGFISIVGQVVLLRELSVAFYGIALVYIISIGIWLFWTAAGAMIGRRYMPSATAVSCLFLLAAVLLPAETAFIRGIRFLFGAIPGTYLPFSRQIIAVFLTLFPVGILLGLMFQWAAKRYIAEGRTLAMAYTAESAGAIMGGLVTTLFFQWGIQNFTVMLLCSFLTALSFTVWHRSAGRYIGAVLCGITALGLWQAREADFQMTRWNHPGLLISRDSPYSRITVEGHKGQFAVFENDALSFETESTAAEEFVHIAAIQRDITAQVFVSGGGGEGIVGEILKHGPQSVIYAELNPVLLELIRKYLPETCGKSLEAKNVLVCQADPRRFLKEDERKYDLILLGMSDPDSGQSNRFYTREYFRQCADRLGPGGILAFRLRSSENLWTPFLTYRNRAVYNALTEVFQDVLILPGTTNTVLASDAPLERNPAKLTERFEQRKIKTRLITPAYITYLYTNDRFSQIAKSISAGNAPPNTDASPICYQYSGMIWLSKFIPGMTHQDISVFDPNRIRMISYLCIAGLFGLFLLIRRRETMRRVTLTAVAGFAGMVLETMLILHYQVKNGVLFQNIGILLTVFMAGLTAGSFAVAKIRNPNRLVGRSLLAAFGCLNLIFIAMLNADGFSDIFEISLLMSVTGFVVAGLFAFASLRKIREQNNAVSALYAADMIGGCAGSLLGSLILIPFLGMEHTAILMTLLVSAALFIV